MLSPYPVESAGSGSRTAYPFAVINHGFQRQAQPFHEPSGPPCTHSSMGAGASAAAPPGSASQARSVVPSTAVVTISSSRPGTSTRPGAGSGGGSWSTPAGFSRTGTGGRSTRSHNANNAEPSRDTQSSL